MILKRSISSESLYNRFKFSMRRNFSKSKQRPPANSDRTSRRLESSSRFAITLGLTVIQGPVLACLRLG
ncbi:hypothetical protein B0H17DRAFT_1067504 [Mycena rosella]|uniref:Uncharacterized protein n=1 Tax=Mycena rosella TaxID=1033263 RepID=A0AAD7DFG7_MYCRO|nr:hypothetical protein B0H17DRAFT_1067504 [Mycena rosella]